MSQTRKLTTMAMLIALSVVLVLAVHIPMFAPYLEYDPGDIPILVGGFLFGPLAGLIITAVTATLQGLTISASSGPWGVIMHILATGSFVLVASLIYSRKKTFKFAVAGLICGAVASIAIMIPANLIVTPLWNGTPVQAVKEAILPVILPFNAVKVGINGVVTFLLYKPISNLIKKPVMKKDEGTQGT